MRSRTTNFLQGVVLLTGIVYIIIGISLYISPLAVLTFFAENVSENWLDLVKDHELVAPLYYISRGFAALLLTSGIAMVLPLFDPLRYRGLIYYNGLIFPFLASIVLMKNGIYFIFMERRQISDIGSQVANVNTGPSGHLVVLVLGVVFTVILLLTIIGLIITKRNAKDGVE